MTTFMSVSSVHTIVLFELDILTYKFIDRN